MTTSEATARAIDLCPEHSVICTEFFRSTKFTHHREEGSNYMVTILPAITGPDAGQRFIGPSFEHCLDKLAATIASAIAP